MISKLIQEYRCDHQYCGAKARVETGSMECGTDYSKECQRLEKRGWAVIGFKHYCKAHKIHHSWGSDMVAQTMKDLGGSNA